MHNVNPKLDLVLERTTDVKPETSIGRPLEHGKVIRSSVSCVRQNIPESVLKVPAAIVPHRLNEVEMTISSQEKVIANYTKFIGEEYGRIRLLRNLMPRNTKLRN